VRVLVADDDLNARETTRVLLEVWGHEVCAAHDGTTALQAVDGFRPDVVLLALALGGRRAGWYTQVHRPRLR
jgi:two-component system CheB/CheR fusion protein